MQELKKFIMRKVIFWQGGQKVGWFYSKKLLLDKK